MQRKCRAATRGISRALALALLAAPHPPAIAQDKPLLRGTEQPNSPSKKEEIGARQQVLCISHLPQVAAAADCHVQVVKREAGGRTRSELQVLDEAGRLEELARMLGSVEGQGDTALAHAGRLLASQRIRKL